MPTHLLLWFKNLGAAYVAADFGTRAGARILELFGFGSRGHLFLELPKDFGCESFLNSLTDPPHQRQILKDLPESVIHAYLSLTNPPLGEDLLIYENSFVGESLKVAAEAVRGGLQILDLRFLRDTTGHSYLMLTGSRADCTRFAESIPANMNHIKNPGEALRDFFPSAL